MLINLNKQVINKTYTQKIIQLMNFQSKLVSIDLTYRSNIKYLNL